MSQPIRLVAVADRNVDPYLDPAVPKQVLALVGHLYAADPNAVDGGASTKDLVAALERAAAEKFAAKDAELRALGFVNGPSGALYESLGGPHRIRPDKPWIWDEGALEGVLLQVWLGRPGGPARTFELAVWAEDIKL